MDVIGDPIGGLATKYSALVCLPLLKSPTFVMRCPRPETQQPNTSTSDINRGESEQLLSCWHIVFCAQGDDPAVLHLPPLDAALSAAHLNLRPQLCLAPVKPQKNRGQGRPCFFSLSCDFSAACGPSGSVADPISALTFKDKSVSSRAEVCDQVRPRDSAITLRQRTTQTGRLSFCCGGADSNCSWHSISL